MKKTLLSTAIAAVLPVGGASAMTTGAYSAYAAGAYRAQARPLASAGLNPEPYTRARKTEASPSLESISAEQLTLQAAQQVRELVIIDASVRDKALFYAQVQAGQAVLEIAADEDGLSQLQAGLQAYSDLEALHIISHATAGSLQLGNAQVDTEALSRDISIFNGLNAALKPGADIHFYGCDLASGEQGEAFLDLIQANTHADLAASDDKTGSASKGGDWELEIQRGDVTASTQFSAVAMQDFSDVLAFSGTLNFNNMPTGYASTKTYTVPTTTYDFRVQTNDGSNGLYNFAAGYVYVGTASSTNTSTTLDFSTGEVFDLSSLYIYNSSGSNRTFRITSDKGGSVDSASLGNNSGQTVSFSGAQWLGVSTVTIAYDDGAFLSWSKLDNVVIANAGAANTAPSLGGTPADDTATEDVATAIDLSAYNITDADGDAITLTLAVDRGTIASIDGNGTTSGVTVASSGTASMTLQGSQANLNTYLNDTSKITFTTASNDTTTAVLTVTPNDGTDNGAADTVNITISAVNDDPTATGISTDITVTEDTLSNVDLSAMTLNDVDSANITVTLTASAGSFATPADGAGVGSGVTETLVSATVITLVGAPADINTYLDTTTNIQYTGASNVSGFAAATIGVTANDGDGSGDVNLGTINVNITAVNDDPTATGFPTDLSFAYETQGNVDLSATSFADVDSASITVTLQVSGGTFATPADGAGVGGGVIETLAAANTVTLVGAPADITTYLDTVSNVQYSPANGVSGDNLATLTVTANDGDGSGNVALGTVNIDVAAETTPPTLDGANSSPADNAVDVLVGSDIVLDFDENIAAGTGNITLRDVTNSATIQVFDITSATATTSPAAGALGISGDKLYINPTTDLSDNTEYAIRVDATAIDDAVGNSFAGISDDTSYNFTTEVFPPTVTTATYDHSTGVLTVTGTNFVANGSGADVDASAFTLTGQGGATHTLSDTVDIEISSATEFTLTLSANDRLSVNGLLNKNGTQAGDGVVYNLAAADDFITAVTSGNSADATGNTITVSNAVAPAITSATYDVATGTLVVTGSNFVKTPGANNDVDVSLLSVFGESSSAPSASYTNNRAFLASSDVEITSSTSFTLVVASSERDEISGLLTANGTSAENGNVYNLNASDNWMPGAANDADIAEASGNGITVANAFTASASVVSQPSYAGAIDGELTTSVAGGVAPYTYAWSNGAITATNSNLSEATYNVWVTDAQGTVRYNTVTLTDPALPTVTNAAYDHSSGVLTVTGANFTANGTGADVDASAFTLTGQGGTYTLTDTADVEIGSATSFALTLSATDRLHVNGLLNKNGTQAGDASVYNLAAADDFITVVTSGNSADTTGNAITVSNLALPAITSATYDVVTGTLVVTGANFVKIAGANNDVDVSLLSVFGESNTASGVTYSNNRAFVASGDVEITSSTSFTLVVASSERDEISGLLTADGTSAENGNGYSLNASDNWMPGAANDADIAETSGNTLTVSNAFTISVAVVTQPTYFGAADGEVAVTPSGGAASAYTYSWSNAATTATVSNLPAGTYTAYVADAQGTLREASVVLNDPALPAITSATYDGATGVLNVTASTLGANAGAANDVDVSQLTLTGEGGASRSLQVAGDVEITSATSFSVTLTGADKAAVDVLLNQAGTSAADGTTYNLAAADDWLTVTPAGQNIADLTGNTITVTNPADITAPRITNLTRFSPAAATTNADTLVWQLSFNEQVTGVDATDFTVTGTTATVTSVINPAPNTYRITVSGGDLAELNATVTLALAAGQNIADLATNALVDITPTGTNQPDYAVSNNSAPVITNGDGIDLIIDLATAAPYALNLSATDVDTSDTLTWSLASAASNGSVVLSGTGTDQTAAYTPSAGFTETDSFVVEVSDGTAIDSITVSVLSVARDALDTIAANADGGTAPLTEELYRDAGIEGVDTSQVLALINNAVALQTAGTDVDEAAEIQALVNAILEGQDADDDGLPNLVEGDVSTDTDGDGLADRNDNDADNDGVADGIEVGLSLIDSDDDGVIDVFDADVGNNADIDAGAMDANFDGVNDDFADLAALRIRVAADADGDGIADDFDADVDGDTVIDVGKLDADLDGVDDVVADSYALFSAFVHIDVDGDQQVNHLDLDTDNDGVADVIEAGLIDFNNDALADADQAVLVDASDLPDTDMDATPDLRALSSDGLSFDILASGYDATTIDADDNGRIDDGTDTDHDGLADVIDVFAGWGNSSDRDDDGISDEIDPRVESGPDVAAPSTGVASTGWVAIATMLALWLLAMRKRVVRLLMPVLVAMGLTGNASADGHGVTSEMSGDAALGIELQVWFGRAQFDTGVASPLDVLEDETTLHAFSAAYRWSDHWLTQLRYTDLGSIEVEGRGNRALLDTRAISALVQYEYPIVALSPQLSAYGALGLSEIKQSAERLTFEDDTGIEPLFAAGIKYRSHSAVTSLELTSYSEDVLSWSLGVGFPL